MVGVIREAGWSAAGVYVRLRLAGRAVAERLRDKAGQTSFEYFLLAAGVAILAGAALLTFGGAVKSGITEATSCMTNASNQAASATAGSGIC